MIIETIDLYEYFGLPRGGAAGGYLKTYVRNPIVEIKPKLRPAMLVLPGGGYSYCSKRESEPVAIAFLNAGYSAFLLDYSVQTVYPAPLKEACMAIVYIRENAVKYCVDPEHVAGVGFSAGGHLASMLGNIWNEKEIVQSLGKKAASARPDAVILSYPVVTMGGYTHEGTRSVITGGDKALCERLSVEKRVTDGSAPAFIWHTYEDGSVPVENSLALAAAYRRAGVPFALHIFEKGWHGLSLCNDEVSDQNESDYAICTVSNWLKLSLEWLKARGFCVKIKN